MGSQIRMLALSVPPNPTLSLPLLVTLLIIGFTRKVWRMNNYFKLMCIRLARYEIYNILVMKKFIDIDFSSV